MRRVKTVSFCVRSATLLSVYSMTMETPSKHCFSIVVASNRKRSLPDSRSCEDPVCHGRLQLHYLTEVVHQFVPSETKDAETVGLIVFAGSPFTKFTLMILSVDELSFMMTYFLPDGIVVA